MTTKPAARKTTAAKAEASPAKETETVHVKDGYLVYFDGEQRGGTLTDVPADLAQTWRRHGWATPAE
jgi:hypothetical protein